MNVVLLHDPLPMDVTFFIGPVGAPPKFKNEYQRAVELSAAGDSGPLDELLEIQIKTLRQISEDIDTVPSPLRRLIESLIDCEIGSYSVYVSKGFTRKIWTPVVTINLDQLTGVDGSPIGHLLLKAHGEAIAAMLGLIFKADWIFTSWAYPGTPIDIKRKSSK
jgi:hypothetical protein